MVLLPWVIFIPLYDIMTGGNAYPSGHLISSLVFIEVHVVQSFVFPYFM